MELNRALEIFEYNKDMLTCDMSISRDPEHQDVSPDYYGKDAEDLYNAIVCVEQYIKNTIPIEWLKKNKCSNIVDLWERECRLKDTEGILEELLLEHNFKSYNDYVEYARTITALPQEDRLNILFRDKENETN